MQTQNNHPLHKAVEQLKSMDKIDIHGKQYASVASRVEAFRTNFPSASIETVLIHDDEQRVVIQARIIIDGNLVATGYAEEYRNDGFINSTSALENAETSAIGRSLSACGLSGSEHYASSNEVNSAVVQQEQIQPVQNNQHKSNHQTSNNTYQKPYQYQNDFSALINAGLQIVDNGDLLVVTGDGIFDKKNIIKNAGFRWSAQDRVWYMQKRLAA